MVPESNLSTETINFITTLLQILPNDTLHSISNDLHSDAVSHILRVIKKMRKAKQQYKHPSSHPSNEIDISNQLSSVSSAPILFIY